MIGVMLRTIPKEKYCSYRGHLVRCRYKLGPLVRVVLRIGLSFPPGPALLPNAPHFFETMMIFIANSENVRPKAIFLEL